jgi:excisionase family DNA binding protein
MLEKNTNRMEHWLTIDELACVLKVKKSWLYRQTMRSDKGAIPRIKLGKQLRFDPAEVEPWILRRN